MEFRIQKIIEALARVLLPDAEFTNYIKANFLSSPII